LDELPTSDVGPHWELFSDVAGGPRLADPGVVLGLPQAEVILAVGAVSNGSIGVAGWASVSSLPRARRFADLSDVLAVTIARADIPRAGLGTELFVSSPLCHRVACLQGRAGIIFGAVTETPATIYPHSATPQFEHNGAPFLLSGVDAWFTWSICRNLSLGTYDRVEVSWQGFGRFQTPGFSVAQVSAFVAMEFRPKVRKREVGIGSGKGGDS